MDAVVLNCVTKFNIVWRVRTFPFLPMSKCRRNTRCVTVAEPLLLKNISTANARCCSDQRCMMTEGFKPLYRSMCVSPRHLQRCWHGAKFKSSNCFCHTLYNCNWLTFRCLHLFSASQDPNFALNANGYAVVSLVIWWRTFCS